MENVVAFEVARSLMEKFSGDSMHQALGNYEIFMEMARRLPLEETPASVGLEAEQTEE